MALAIQRSETTSPAAHHVEELNYFLWIPSSSYEEEEEVLNNILVAKKEGKRKSETGSNLGVPASKVSQLFSAAANGRKVILASNAVSIARQLGYAPSKEEERILKKRYNDAVSYKDFELWLKEVEHDEDDVAFLTTIFRKYDTTKKGVLTKKQLQTILTEKGDEDSLTLEEFEQLTRITNMTNDVISYEELCRRILERKHNKI